MIPAIVPTADERRAEPIPLRQNEPTRVAPEDAPVLLVSSRPTANNATTDSSGRRPQVAPSAGEMPAPDTPLDGTRRNLETYQHQLQGALDSLTKGGGAAGLTPASPGLASTVTASAASAAGLFGGELQKSATPRVSAGLLGDRSLILPKGTAFTCALKTKLISAASGFVSCQVQRNVFSDDGRVLLVERGSHMDGGYRIASVRPGTVRIPVLWTRIRTPLGVTVDIESPGTGPLGESGIDGDVDNRWPERIGAAMLLSLIDDSVKLAIEDRGSAGTGNTILLPSTTSSTSKLAENVLDSTINIPPLIYQNQGGIVGIYVARDVDFSSVYELKAGQR
jgi:type IV secretion system protein VirB10